MPIFEFYCKSCRIRFEEILSSNAVANEERIACPKCTRVEQTERLISRFAVGGQGDLRESTYHGCHGCHSGHNHGGGGHSDSSDGGSDAH